MPKHDFSTSLVIKEMQINAKIQFFHQISKKLNSKNKRQQILKFLNGTDLI